MTRYNDRFFYDTLKDLQDDHLTTLRRIRSLAYATHRFAREVAGLACVYARDLRADSTRRTEFYAEAFPGGWQRFHRRKLLLHVLMYFYGVTDRSSVGYSTASAHSVALRDLYGDNNISDEGVMRHIHASGIFGVLHCDDDGDALDEESAGCVAGAISRRQPTRTSVLSDDDFEISDDDEDVNYRMPVRKAPKPKVMLKRLPRPYIDSCVQARPKTAAMRTDILQAIRDGKSVSVTLVPGDIMEEYELDKEGGPFIETIIDEYRVDQG